MRPVTEIGRAVHAEWTKLRTLQSTPWLLLLTAGSMITMSLAVTGTLRLPDDCTTPCFEDTVKLSLLGVRLGQAGVVILAVLAVTAEYGTRTIKPTLTAMPRRWAVLIGKLGVVTGLALAAGVVGTAGSVLVAHATLPGRGFTPANGYPAIPLLDDLTRRACVGTVLYLGLVALLSAGVALLVRDTGGALTVVLALLFASPLLAQFVSDTRWQHRIHRFSPMDAGLAIQATRDFATIHIGQWAGVGLLAAYAAGAALVGGLAFRLRDA
ncbi:ABC-2 type transport system permease protein [Allocatelliglobosispora scoriae]|uniref:ABC-2 type transport system permease protein n=1 Tax=Allocatelliglobosispora scoriae TaxID=643052 RepID=A0A841C2V7_9ACTN|nr:ABC transporter permease [Allocatelliglobosispora scoriae]MBB5873463.1 ABC-2 type transport system permease protein [Allocatelliglobosispora scoriae]